MAIYFYNKNNKLKTHKFKIGDEHDLYKPIRKQYGLDKLSGIVEPNPHNIDFKIKIEKRDYYDYTGSMIKRRINKGQDLENKINTGRITKQEIAEIIKKHNEEAKKLIDADGRFNDILKNMNAYEERYILDYNKIKKANLIKYDLSRQARASILIQYRDELYNKNNRDIIKDLFLKSIDRLIKYKKNYYPTMKDILISFENVLINYILYNPTREDYKKREYYWEYKELLFIVKEVRKRGKPEYYELEIFKGKNEKKVKKSLRKLMGKYIKRYQELIDIFIN